MIDQSREIRARRWSKKLHFSSILGSPLLNCHLSKKVAPFRGNLRYLIQEALMKLAKKKKTTVKTARAKKAAARNAPADTPGGGRVAAAREMLAGATTSARDAVIATLVHFSPGLVEVKSDGNRYPSQLV